MSTITINQDIRLRVFDLLNLAFDLKEQGHDLFVSYSAHVNSFDVRLHINGWKSQSYPNFTSTLYLDQEPYFTNELCTKLKNDILGLIGIVHVINVLSNDTSKKI